MRFFFLVIPLLLVGCNTLPKIGLTWPESEKDVQIALLERDLKKSQEETQRVIDEKTSEIIKEETNRISQGTAQVYAAYGTLGADPVPNKYTDAASRALVVAKEALPVPKVEDLLEAIEIQKKLLSEQAKEIEEAKAMLAAKSTEIIDSKQKVKALEQEKELVAKELNQTEQEYTEKLTQLARERDQEKLALLQERDSLAQKWKKENSFWARINPLNGLARTFSSLFFWAVLIVVIGLILKVASVIFPGVNIIQALIGGIGRIIGSVIGMFVKWIPDALRGMSAVDYKQYQVEKRIANNSVGAIENFKQENPTLYAEKLKPKLEDWNKDSHDLDVLITKKLSDLNQI